LKHKFKVVDRAVLSSTLRNVARTCGDYSLACLGLCNPVVKTLKKTVVKMLCLKAGMYFSLRLDNDLVCWH